MTGDIQRSISSVVNRTYGNISPNSASTADNVARQMVVSDLLSGVPQIQAGKLIGLATIFREIEDGG